MNRSDFLKAVAAGSALAACAPAIRRTLEYTHELAAPPDRVFPLLCPVREYEWIDGWQCRLVYSKSGVAEKDCVFTTESNGVTMVWTCSHYEPPQRIAYVAVGADAVVMHLEIALEPRDGRTLVHWKRTFTGLSEAGNRGVEQRDTSTEKRLEAQLEHFLKTGRILRGGH